MTPEEAKTALAPLGIQATLEEIEDTRGEGDHERLTLKANGHTVVIESQDHEGYRSWFRLVEPPEAE